MRRDDQKLRPHFRTASRFYQQDGDWYYSTREGDHGPFSSREDAEADARLYAGLHSHLQRPKQAGSASKG